MPSEKGETTIPVSIAVLGHPLVQSAAIFWSANEGMIPQSLLFNAAGGIAEATVSSENPGQIQIKYSAKINFSLPDWGLVEISGTQAIAEGGNHITLDPKAWIKTLTVQLVTPKKDQDPSFLNSTTHLIVNLTWRGLCLNHSIKSSGRITPHQSHQFLYIQGPQQNDLSAQISGFGVINQHLIRLNPHELDLSKTLITVIASPNHIQLQSA